MGVKIHKVEIFIAKTSIQELEDGAEIKLVVRAACPEFCDLRERVIQVADNDKLSLEVKLTKFNGVENETDEIIVKTGNKPGEYTWTAVFPEQEYEGVIHQEASAEFTFKFQPHTIGIAVWDTPFPVTANSTFSLKVGAKCSAGCNLQNKEIEIYNHEGILVATDILNDLPWQDTVALYWKEIELKAPAQDHDYSWQVKLPKSDQDPHKEACSTFILKVVKEPDSLAVVQVVDKETLAPVPGALVTLHPYNAKTDTNGIAELKIAKGEYKLYVTGLEKYEVYRSTVNVVGNSKIKIELTTPPELVEDA